MYALCPSRGPPPNGTMPLLRWALVLSYTVLVTAMTLALGSVPLPRADNIAHRQDLRNRYMYVNRSLPLPRAMREVSVDIVQLWWAYSGLRMPKGQGYSGTPAEARRAMSDASTLGMRYYRFAATHYWPQQMKDTYLAAESDYWHLMDVLFADAEQLRVGLIPSLCWNPFMFADLAGDSLYKLFTDSSSRSNKILEGYVVKFVRRYQHSPALFAWEIGNENNLHVDLDFGRLNMSQIDPRMGTPTHRSRADNISTSDLVTFQHRVAGWIRAADNHKHPVSTGHSTPRPSAWHLAQNYLQPGNSSRWVHDTEAQFDRTVAIQATACDLISFHYYGWVDNVRFGKTLGDADSAALFPHMVRAANAAGKQWYMGEFGTRSPADRNFTLNLLNEVSTITHGPVLATMWTWEFSWQPNITVNPNDTRAGDEAVIQRIQAVNALLQRPQLTIQGERLAIPMKLDDNNFELVVYGATSGGVVAAVAAVRTGATRVALLDPGSRIGGMSAGGLSHTDTGDASVIGGMAKQFYLDNGHYYNLSKPEYMLESHVALNIFQRMVNSANVSLFSNAEVETVSKTGAQITSITTVDGRTFSADVYIEADYEGDLMARAGADYAIGREGVAKYNESLNGIRTGNKGHEFSVVVDPFETKDSTKLLPMVTAFDPTSWPGDPDNKTQAYNFRLCVTTNPANMVPFTKPEQYDSSYWELARRYFTNPQIVPCVRAPSGNVAGCHRNSQTGEWHQPENDSPSVYEATADHRGADLNNGGPISTDFVGGSWRYPEANYSERKEIIAAHKLYTQSFLWFMSTDPALNESIRSSFRRFGLCADEFQDTDHWPPSLYVRAARRLVGEQVFTQNTPSQHRDWGNQSIGCGSYNFDSHTADRIACPNVHDCRLGPAGVEKGASYAWMEGDVETGPGVYDIPMWVLFPKREQVSNLLVVASPSASHIGMSTLRMEPQFMIMGQSAGVIAALGLRTGLLSEGKPIHEVNRAILHHELLQGGQLMNDDCHIPSPSPPPGPHAAAYIVSGAGSASCNGHYNYDPSNHRDAGTAFYTKDSGHQIYRSGGVWRIAHGLILPNFLWYTSTEDSDTPPSGNWTIVGSGGKGVEPAPTLRVAY